MATALYLPPFLGPSTVVSSFYPFYFRTHIRTPISSFSIFNTKHNYHLFNNVGHRLHVQAFGSLSSEDAAGGTEGDTLLSEFMNHVFATQQLWPLEGRTPTPLMPPNTVVKVQMDALMRNDWPEENSGIRTAFLFSKPDKVEEMRVGQAVEAARAWKATESYLSFDQFVSDIKESLYAPIINCLHWEVRTMCS
eukprot:Gb_21798 [translate_table: standard]